MTVMTVITVLTVITVIVASTCLGGPKLFGRITRRTKNMHDTTTLTFLNLVWIWGFVSAFVVHEARRGFFIIRGLVVENGRQPWPWPLITGNSHNSRSSYNSYNSYDGYNS